MDIAFQNIRIRKYILSTLRDAEKNVVDYYIKSHNPFYKWRIGSLFEKEIVTALSVFFGTNETSEKIKASVATSKAFALLIASYKEKEVIKAPELLTHSKWLEIRNLYEEKRKKEYEITLGTISHNENIDYSGEKYNKSDDDTVSRSSPSNQAGEVDEELSILRELEASVQYLLDNIYQENWVVEAQPLGKSGFEYKVAIINLNVDEEILIKTVSFLKGKYPKAFFQVKDINGQNYIEGLMNIR